MDIDEDTSPGFDMEDKNPSQTQCDPFKSGHLPLSETGTWNDDLRLLVTVGGTEYLYEKLNLVDKRSNTTKICTCPGI